jgi:putative DNA primase/helicase
MIKHIPTITKNQRNETLSYLEAVAEDVELSHINKIPVKNGLYNLDTDELEEFTPSYISKNKIPTAYNPAAKSSLIDKFLDDLACGDSSIRAVIEEMIGTTLYRSSDFDAFFILVGDGSNGKSTLLDLIIQMLGEENVCSVELKDLDKTFKTAELFGKLANIGDDISSNDIKNSSFIKKLASGNRVNVEKKGKNPFDMKPYAKMIFSSNTTPVIHDTSHGLNRRLVLIPLNNKFEQNVHFKNQIMTTENLEYLLLLAIKGLKRVLKNNGKFTSSKVIEKASSYKTGYLMKSLMKFT